MSDSNKKHIYLLIKIWLVYFVLSRLVLRFPHWEVPAISLINFDLFFIMFLISFFIFKKDKNYPYIYLNLALATVPYLLGMIVMFVGTSFSLGSDYLMYAMWSWRKILISIFMTIAIVFIPTNYMFRRKKIWCSYLLTLSVVFAIAFLYYRKFLLDKNLLFEEHTQYQLLSSGIGMNFLAIFFIGIYGLIYLYFDRPISGYINLLLLSSLIYLLLDSSDNYFIIYKKNLPATSQFFLLFNLLFYVAILSHKFILMEKEFVRFYENLLESKIDLQIKILRKKSWIDKLILVLKKYFKPLPNKIFFSALTVFSLSFFLYFYPYGYTKINLLIIISILSILIIYLYILVNKRMRNQFIRSN